MYLAAAVRPPTGEKPLPSVSLAKDHQRLLRQPGQQGLEFLDGHHIGQFNTPWGLLKTSYIWYTIPIGVEVIPNKM
jgi:hypothetical protein